jgi:phosphatidyl-myo-inositol dimannoside synthase
VARPEPLVIAPGVAGRDGISRLSHEVVTALAESDPVRPPEVWVLNDEIDGTAFGGKATIRAARRRRGRIVGWSLARGLRAQEGRPVFVLHAHLTPLAIPLVLRGATLVPFLIGIEVWKPLTRLQRLAFSRATRLISISDHTAKEFGRANPQLASIATTVCHPGLPERSAPFARAGSRSRVALIVGRMCAAEKYKGHDLLIETWRNVLRAVDDAELHVVGGGDDRGRLEAKVASLGLAARIRFLGELPDEQLEREYRNCAFFVLPSSREGFGLVFLEAMRAGKACIGCRGAASEIIEDGVSGFVLEPGDRECLTGAVIRLFQEDASRERMGRRSQEIFERKFTRARFRACIERMLEEVKASAS